METRATILVVDDESAGREALEGVLFSQGYSLLFAENGKEAYQKALEYMPDLILLDVMMPNMDGFEVCQKMRTNALLAEIPVILITALDDRASLIKGIEAGADDFISKPFDRIELRARVRTITRLNRYRRLLMERARFVWATEQSKEGFVILNAKDIIKYANPSARLLLHLPMEEKTPVEFLAWVQKQYVCEPEEAWVHWQDPQPVESVFYLIRPGAGSSRLVWLQIEVLSLPAGNESNRLLRISEVTEKLALYQEVWSFQKTITHKLRTPLSNLVMAAELLHRQMNGNIPQESQALLQEILLDSKRFCQDVEDILGYLNLPPVAHRDGRFNMAAFEELVLQTCKELSLDKVTMHIDRALPRELSLKLSHQAVEVILWELVENARKFHPTGDPTIEIRASMHGAGFVKVVCKDNGAFLAPDQLRQAWLPYYQAEKEFTGEVEGIGLGLSTVAKMIWEVGGKYRLANREDSHGVMVELILPVAMEAAQNF